MATTKLPHMPLWVYDIKADESCQMMTASQFGVYMRLLIHQWTEGSIPSDPDDLAFLVGRCTSFSKTWAVVSRKFVETDDGRLINERLDGERREVLEKVERRRKAGAKGAQSRWDGGANADANSSRNGNANSNRNATPITQASESESVSKSSSFCSSDVERIYQAYPRQVGKQAALEAIHKALKAIDQPDPVAWLLSRVEAFAASDAGNRGKYTPHPATWLNEGRYDDDDAEWGKDDDGAGERNAERSEAVDRREAERKRREREATEEIEREAREVAEQFAALDDDTIARARSEILESQHGSWRRMHESKPSDSPTWRSLIVSWVNKQREAA